MLLNNILKIQHNALPLRAKRYIDFRSRNLYSSTYRRQKMKSSFNANYRTMSLDTVKFVHYRVVRREQHIINSYKLGKIRTC